MRHKCVLCNFKFDIECLNCDFITINAYAKSLEKQVEKLKVKLKVKPKQLTARLKTLNDKLEHLKKKKSKSRN